MKNNRQLSKHQWQKCFKECVRIFDLTKGLRENKLQLLGLTTSYPSGLKRVRFYWGENGGNCRVDKDNRGEFPNEIKEKIKTLKSFEKFQNFENFGESKSGHFVASLLVKGKDYKALLEELFNLIE